MTILDTNTASPGLDKEETANGMRFDVGANATDLPTEIESESALNGNRQELQCTHCGLPVPSGYIRPEDSNQFCCNGCRTAFELISGCELEDFYRMAESRLKVPSREKSDFEELDTEYFRDNHTKPLHSGARPLHSGNAQSGVSRTVTFAIEGLHCSACIWLIEKLPQICPGVLNATVNWNSQSVKVVYDSRLPLSRVAQTLADLGYFPTVFEQDKQLEKSRLENRRSLFDLGLAGAAAGNNMLVALALYLGQYYGMTLAIERLLIFYSGLISLVSVLGPGRKILSKALWAVRTRTPHMDLPVAIGMSVGLIAGWGNIFAGSSAVFFDSISVLVFVLLLGRYIQQLQQRTAIAKLSLVNRLLPRFCQRKTKGVIAKVSIDEIQSGDIVQIGPNETVPVDGRLLKGQSTVDQSILTGESFPVATTEGQELFAGTINLEDVIEIEATESVHESKIATIFQDVEQSVRKKTRVVQFADRIGAKFVIVVLVLALATFLLWMPDLTFAANAAVAVLIVACPCALALATPVAISVALNSSLKRGILIKDGDVFERLTKCQTIWFDKTGTLTEGNLEITDWVGDDRYKKWVAAVEAKSSQPIARAILDSLKHSERLTDEDLAQVELENVEYYSSGLSAKVAGSQLFIGSRKLMNELGQQVGGKFEEVENHMLCSGWSPVFVAVSGSVVAMMSVGDQLRQEAIPVIQRLKKRFRIGILSGDRREIVDRVAQKLGIDPSICYSELTPNEKSKKIAESDGTLMIGDGVNDSSALAEASVGMAINDRLDLNSRIAPIVLGSDQLDQVPELMSASRRVMRLIYRNISISLAYNVLAVSLAIAGYIHPVIAAIFMPISSITILLVSLLFNPFGGKEK